MSKRLKDDGSGVAALNEALADLTAGDVASAVARGDHSATDVVEAVLARIQRLNPDLNALIEFDPEGILAHAAQVDSRTEPSCSLPLLGVPFTLKEVTPVKGASETLGMAPFRHQRGTHDGTLYRRLTDAGGIYLGKTHQAEAGFAGISVNSVHGAAANPWNHDHNAGGSSSGAGIAVAAGMGPIAEGGDGAGSIRIPAAMCGVVGFKPSLGHVPNDRPKDRFGASFLFHGPLARSVDDVRLMYNIMRGVDPTDPLSQIIPDAPVAARRRPLRAIWSEDMGLDVWVDQEVRSICRAALDEAPAALVDVQDGGLTWDGIDMQEAMWNGIWLPSFRRHIHMLGGERQTLHPKLNDMLDEAHALTFEAYLDGVEQRSLAYDVYRRTLSRADILISPTLTVAGFELNEFTPPHLRTATLREQLLGWLLTYPANMTGAPAITIPIGVSREGLPVGLQIIGRLHGDEDLLTFAAQLSRSIAWRPDYSSLGMSCRL